MSSPIAAAGFACQQKSHDATRHTRPRADDTPALLRFMAISLLCALRYALYLPLLWLRPIVAGLSHLLVPLLGVSGVAYGFIVGWTLRPSGLLLISSLTVMVVAYLYDLALALISPDDVTFYS